MQGLNLNKLNNNKTLRNVGIAALAIGALYYPGMLLYKYISKRMKAGKESSDEETHPQKAFAPSLRTNHKPHHRHAKMDGQQVNEA